MGLIYIWMDLAPAFGSCKSLYSPLQTQIFQLIKLFGIYNSRLCSVFCIPYARGMGFININRKLEKPNFVRTDSKLEDTTSELNTSKKRYNSKVKVAICTTNSNINKKPSINVASLWQWSLLREHDSEGFRDECSHCVTGRQQWGDGGRAREKYFSHFP